MAYEQERQGPGRRASDYAGHCDLHQHNSDLIDQHGTVLTELKTGVLMVKWILGIAVSFGTLFIGLAYSQSHETQRSMQSDLKEIKAVTSTVPTELRYMKEDIIEIRSHIK